MLSKHSGKTGKWFPKRSLRRRILWFLSCLVVFCTTYALILPAITLANETYCHLDEHQHDENCFRSPESLCNQESPESGTAPPHEHDETCYDENQNLICDKQEQTSVHQHTDECYRSDKPLCGKEEHTHSKMCYSNQEDVEKKEDWEKTLPKKLDGTTRENLISVAESQIGYKENEFNFILDSDENVKNYSRYGEWYGKPYEDWNLMFMSFLLHYSEISDIPYGHDWKEWKEDLEKEEISIQEPEDLISGDIVVFHENPENEKQEGHGGKSAENYIGILSSVKPQKIITGDWHGKVSELDVKKEKLIIHGVLPYSETVPEDPEPDVEQTDPDHGDSDSKQDSDDETNRSDTDSDEQISEPDPVPVLNEIYQYENDDFYFEVKPVLKGIDSSKKVSDKTDDNVAAVDNQPVDSDPKQETSLISSSDSAAAVKEKELFGLSINESNNLDESDGTEIVTTEEIRLEINEISDEPASSEEDVVDRKRYELKFISQEKEINTDAYVFDLSVIPKKEYLSRNIEKALGEQHTEINEIVLSLESDFLKPELNSSNEVTAQADEKAESDLSERQYDLEQEIQPLILANVQNEFSVRADRVPNPSFEVQTYGYIEKTANFTGGEKILAFNQTNDKKLSSQQNYPLVPETAGSNNYILKTDTVLEKIYTTKTYKYHQAPNIYYFNQLIDNSSYQLDELWVLNDGKEGSSDDPLDWSIYKDPMSKLYTNNETTYQTAPDKYVLIRNDGKSVLRLIYSPIKTTYQSRTQFFDYDITDGKVYKDSSGKSGYATAKEATPRSEIIQGGKYPTLATNGQGMGINSPENFAGQDGKIKYGFGNANTGIPFDIILAQYNDRNGLRYINIGSNWDSNSHSPNRNYPVLDMISHIEEVDGQRIPVFNQQIQVPDLFSSNEITGKTIVDGGSLKFSRKGDTYTLTDALINDKTVVSNLDKFSHPVNGNSTYDWIWTNHFWPLDDGKYGKDPKTGGSTVERFGYLDEYEKYHALTTYPPSDNGIAHNNLFGMKFEVEFTLDGTYEGPLEYFFFGDDDLWVFVDDTLIADIGGVKQSKGVYVDLRQKMPELNNKTKEPSKHRLTVFYTERGLSGSTCYMEFTLPSVSGVENSEKTGGFKLSKQTFDDDIQTEFQFDIRLLDENGVPLGNDYAYLKFKKSDENPMEHPEEDWLIMPSNSRVTLRKDEFLIVKYLPIGSRFVIEEVLPENVQTEVRFEPRSDNKDDPPNIYSGTIGSIKPGEETSESIPEIVCINKRFYKLPETGGFGIERHLISGGILISISILLLLYRERERRRY